MGLLWDGWSKEREVLWLVRLSASRTGLDFQVASHLQP